MLSQCLSGALLTFLSTGFVQPQELSTEIVIADRSHVTRLISWMCVTEQVTERKLVNGRVRERVHQRFVFTPVCERILLKDVQILDSKGINASGKAMEDLFSGEPTRVLIVNPSYLNLGGSFPSTLPKDTLILVLPAR